MAITVRNIGIGWVMSGTRDSSMAASRIILIATCSCVVLQIYSKNLRPSAEERKFLWQGRRENIKGSYRIMMEFNLYEPTNLQ